MKIQKKRETPFLLILFFLFLLLVGINSGEVSSVLETATRICLSCIGIG